MFPRTAIVMVGALSLGLLPMTANAATPKKSAPAKKAAAAKPAAAVPDVAAYTAQNDYSGLEQKLIEYFKTCTPALSERNLDAAMLLQVIQTTGADVMKTFADADPEHAKFLAAFCKDAAWQHIYLSQGLVPYHTPIGIEILFDIWKNDGGQVKNKPLASAIASVWGGGETWQKVNIAERDRATHNPVWRYNYFQDKAAKGQLHPNYKNLKAWELRFVVGIPAQDWDDASYTWAFENINLPWDQYGWACWAAIYTDPSKFGDSVQTSYYHVPYESESWAEATQKNGGVCGALSHLGTFACMAHGIPATTVGQPGHCAYGYRLERGKWEGGFGGPDGGMHNHIFGHSAPTSYRLMEAVFGDDATIDKAYKQSYIATALAAAGRDKDAVKAWQKTLQISPLHPFFRAALHKLMLADNATPDAVYDYLAKTIPLYKGLGMAGVNMAEDLSPVIAKMTDKQKIALFTAMHRNIAESNYAWAVDNGEFVKKQVEMLGSDAAKQVFLADVFATHLAEGDGSVFGLILEWAVKEYSASNRMDLFGKAFSAAAAKSAGSTAGADADKLKKLANAYNKAIIAAEQAKSAPAFEALTEGALKSNPIEAKQSALEKPDAIPGKVAECSLFRISTSAGPFDTPSLHKGLMTLAGGKCHTTREEKPTFIVDLAQPGEMTGCIIRKSDGMEERMKKAVVYTSADGATWFERARTDNMPKEWAVTFPEGTKGKWVKLEFQNDKPEFAHINHFVIFTK